MTAPRTAVGATETLGAPYGLLCELMAEASLTTIADPRPEFGWVVNDPRRGARQSAYQLVVATSRAAAEHAQGEVWDSGKVRSDRSVNVEYAGKPLQPHRSYFWRVRTWDVDGVASPWSEVQEFRTGDFTGKPDPWANRYPLVKTAVAPIRIVRKGKGHWFIDFGRAAFGTIWISADCPDTGRKVEVHLGEVPVAGKDEINRNPGGSRRYRRMVVSLRKGSGEYTVAITPDHRNTHGAAVLMPKEVGEVMPFRYCELVGYPGELTPAKIHQIAVHYRFGDNAADFTSSSRVLNDVWELCKYSVKATSFLGIYVDGDRERIPYEGDAYINQLCHYCVDREYTLARHTLEYLLTHPTWPMEWHLHLPLIAWADYLYTGNDEFLRAHYDELAAKTLVGLAREDGLIEEDKAMMTPAFRKSIHFAGELRSLVDWPPASFSNGRYGERDGYDMRPVNTVVNAFHYRALVLMAKIAEAIGKPGDAGQWADRAAKVKQVFNETFFDRTTGHYRDGEGSTHSALHANMFPLAFGLVPAAHVASVVEFIKSRGMACSVYGAQHLVDGLYAAGEADYALSLLTSTSERSWAHMIYDVGSTITLEAWDNKFKPNQDWNHAWGAAPANLIVRGLMGIRPLQPGFARVQIRPQPGPLTHARVKTPTIRGTIEVEVRQQKRRVTTEVLIPANVVAEVWLPTTGTSGVTENGKPLTGEHRPTAAGPGWAKVVVAGGHYRWESG